MTEPPTSLIPLDDCPDEIIYAVGFLLLQEGAIIKRLFYNQNGYVFVFTPHAGGFWLRETVGATDN